MRIGITCYPTYGGSGIVATELGLELANRRHEVHFISYANPIRLDPGIPRIHYHEVEVSTYPLFQYPPYSLALATRMAEVAEAYELDLLHVHYAIPHSISALLARQRRVDAGGLRHVVGQVLERVVDQPPAHRGHEEAGHVLLAEVDAELQRVSAPDPPQRLL